jgi:hypothetical protein
MTERIYAAEKAPECPFLARSGHCEGYAKASAITPKADIRPAKEGPLMPALGSAYELRRRHTGPPPESMVERAGL